MTRFWWKIISIRINQCKTCKSQEMGCSPKWPGQGTSCTVPLICWEMLSLGKADSTSLILLSSLLPFPIFLNEYPSGIWCFDASFIQPVAKPSGEPLWTHWQKKILFSTKSEVWTVFFKTKRHFNNKEIIFYITPGYWCVPGIRDYFYRFELWITSHSLSTSFKTWFTQHKKRTKGK